jgi:hypothetical protein
LLLVRLEKPLYKGLPNKGKSRQGSVNLEGQYKVRKRGILKEDSSLGLKGINMSYINLGQLIGGKSCTIPCILFCNRYQVLTSALANSGTNAFTLIDTQYTIKLADFLNAPIEDLPKPIPIYRYNGWVGQPIMSILQIHLRVNG